MAQKHVLAFFRRPPFGSIHYLEGLRMCLGLATGEDGHRVEIVYLDDGVYYALRETDRSDAADFLAELKDAQVLPFVAESSLRARGIAASELSPDYRVVSTEEPRKLVADCDLSITF